MILALCCPLASAAPPAPPTTPPVASEMHQRFFTLTTARDAVVQGRLRDAQQAIAPLTRADPSIPAGDPFPAAWRPMVAKVEAAAQVVAQAKDLAVAAEGVAKVAVACAECHSATQGGPSLTEGDSIPTQAWLAGQNMPLHKWAIDWMWVGLLANSDEAWIRGATELDQRPLAPKYENAAPPTGMRELEQLVYVVANKALTVEGAVARGGLYGSLLGTCAQCHVLRNAAAGGVGR